MPQVSSQARSRGQDFCLQLSGLLGALSVCHHPLRSSACLRTLERVTTHFPGLAVSGANGLSAWDVSTILLHSVHISSCSCPFPFSLPWPLMLPKHLRDATETRPRCPLRGSVSRENAAVGAHGVSSTARCPGHSSPLYLGICTSHLILSTGEFGSSFTQA